MERKIENNPAMAFSTPAKQPSAQGASPEVSLRDELHALDAQLSALDEERNTFFKEHFELHPQIRKLIIRARDLKEAKRIHQQFDEFGPKRDRIQRKRSAVLHELAVRRFPHLGAGQR